MEIPACGNFLNHSCERSDTFVERETDSAFVIRCRTCSAISIWPKDADEKHARYQAFLHSQAQEQQRIVAESRQRAYSISGTRPGER